MAGIGDIFRVCSINFAWALFANYFWENFTFSLGRRININIIGGNIMNPSKINTRILRSVKVFALSESKLSIFNES